VSRPPRAGKTAYGVFNGTGAFPEVQAQYLTLVHSLSALGLLYRHLVDHSSMGAPPVPADFKLKLRAGFDGLFILSGASTTPVPNRPCSKNTGT
jgi:hypothetical protein